MSKKASFARPIASILFGVFAIIAILYMLAYFIGNMDPIQSSEFEALRLSNEISVFLNSMSTIDSGNIIINISKPLDIHIKHVGIFDSQRMINFLNELKIFEFSSGFEKAFTKKGHYIFITPYRGEKQRPFESALILSYPHEQDLTLEKSFLLPKTICIIKEVGEERAEVKECEE